MKKTSYQETTFWQQFGYFLLFLIAGLLVFVVLSHMRPMLTGSMDIISRIVVITGFLLTALLMRSSHRYNKYWKILFAVFIASLAISLDLYLPSRDWWLKLFNISIKTPAGIAIDKLDSSLIIIITIILLSKISGSELSALYLGKGNVKKSLTIGVILFLIAAAGAIPMSEMFFGGRDLDMGKVITWLPWILIFIIGNAFNEELLFRGLFLKKFSPFVGRFFSNLVIAIPFALHHSGVTYSQDTLLFLAILLPLSLAWGYVMQKTDSIWGSFLFHAGMDIPVILSIFSNL